MAITGAGPVPPLKLIKDISLPISAKLGMKTSRDTSQGFRNTFGETLAAVLCSLASRSQPLEDITEATNGCVIRSKMLSSIWSWEGDLIITLEAKEEGTLMSAAITVPGQLSDMVQARPAGAGGRCDEISRHAGQRLTPGPERRLFTSAPKYTMCSAQDAPGMESARSVERTWVCGKRNVGGHSGCTG